MKNAINQGKSFMEYFSAFKQINPTSSLTYIYFHIVCPVGRKQELDETLVDMIVEDSQPLSIVEDNGFKAFVTDLLTPPIISITIQAGLKAVVDCKYEEQKHKAMAEIQKVDGVCFTADGDFLLIWKRIWPLHR